MTDPKVLAELRELIANAQPAPWDLGTGWPFGNWNWDGMSDERKKATERIVVHLFNHAASLLADSERLVKVEQERDAMLVSTTTTDWQAIVEERDSLSERLAEAEKQHCNLLAELNLCRPYRSQYNALTERLREAEKKISELSLECHSYLSQLAQPHEDPRLRLAVEGLERISTYDDDGTWGNARIKDLARDTLAKIKEAPCSPQV